MLRQIILPLSKRVIHLALALTLLSLMMNHGLAQLWIKNFPTDSSFGGLLGLYSVAYGGLGVVFLGCWLWLLVLGAKSPLLFKIFACLFLLVGGATYPYYQDFGIVYDKQLINILLHTNQREAGEALYLSGMLKFLITGLVPSLALIIMPSSWLILKKEGLKALVGQALSVSLIIVMMGISLHPSLQKFKKDHPEYNLIIFPYSPLMAAFGVAVEEYESLTRVRVKIGEDAMPRPPLDKPLLTLLVVGETARAANYQLGGYPKPTNPWLSERANIYYYPKATSCATFTLYSVPCMFSALGREHFQYDMRKTHENIIDVLSRIGVTASWADNNTGCEFQCDKIPYQEAHALGSKQECPRDGCDDGVLLRLLATMLPSSDPTKAQNHLLVAHILGSHADYNHRVPSEFVHFTPICRYVQLEDCDKDSVYNSYDNSIRYTDYILNEMINQLDKLSESYHVVMLYASDHGESLGENHIYWHARPYDIAPKEQKEIPMLFWLPPATAKALGIDETCLRQSLSHEVSHDNIFHTLFGLYGQSSKDYRPDLDLLGNCRLPPNRK